ncbi:hypothetical protein NWF32_12900 [Pseudomonas qingdaonensis]|nr:hypothetical protein [Pseudomonas qingdaonensis]
MTRTVMALFNTLVTIAYGEMTSLRSRMGNCVTTRARTPGCGCVPTATSTTLPTPRRA